MAADLFKLFYDFDEIFPTTERVFLPVANPFDDLDEKKFKERFRLSKTVVQRLVDEVIDIRQQYYIPLVYKLLRTKNFLQPFEVTRGWLL